MKHSTRHTFIIAITIVASLFISGCSRYSLNQSVSQLMKSTIIIPDNITYIRKSEIISMHGITNAHNHLIVYVDSSECSKCRIEKFARYQDLEYLSKSTGKFDLVFLLSVQKNMQNDIFEFLKYCELDYPIYIDNNNDFRRLNPHVPDDLRLHCFYTDSEGHVRLVGDPVENASIRKIFMRFIKTNSI